MDTLLQLNDKKIIAIARSVRRSDAKRTVEALMDGGIRFVEFTFDQSSEQKREENALIIREVSAAFGSDAFIGAGTVLTPQQVDMAADAGALYIISPDTNEAVIKRSKERGLLSMPGAFTPSEITAAYRAGADVIKLFPAGILGTGYIKSIRAPLKHIPLMATGGVSSENAAEFLQAGCCALGIGGNLVSIKEISDGNFDYIRTMAKLCVEAVEKAAKG